MQLIDKPTDEGIDADLALRIMSGESKDIYVVRGYLEEGVRREMMSRLGATNSLKQFSNRLKQLGFDLNQHQDLSKYLVASKEAREQMLSLMQGLQCPLAAIFGKIRAMAIELGIDLRSARYGEQDLFYGLIRGWDENDDPHTEVIHSDFLRMRHYCPEGLEIADIVSQASVLLCLQAPESMAGITTVYDFKPDESVYRSMSLNFGAGLPSELFENCNRVQFRLDSGDLVFIPTQLAHHVGKLNPGDTRFTMACHTSKLITRSEEFVQGQGPEDAHKSTIIYYS